MEEKIKSIFKNSFCPDVDVPSDTLLEKYCDVNSLNMIFFIVAIEEEFGLDIPLTDMEKWETIQDVVNYVKSKKG